LLLRSNRFLSPFPDPLPPFKAGLVGIEVVDPCHVVLMVVEVNVRETGAKPT